MRETATYIKCDGDGCATMAKVNRDSDTPDGWIRVSEFSQGVAAANFDLCSLRCVEKWSRGRRSFLDRGEAAVQRSTSRRAILELFESDPRAALTTRDVADLVDLTDTGARNTLKLLVDDGEIVEVEKGRRGHSAVFRLAERATA